MLVRAVRKVARLLEKKPPVVRLEDCDFAHPYLNWVHGQVSAHSWRLLRRHYTWGVLQSAYVASQIGVKRISIIEFGVAGGNGLIALDRLPERIRRFFEVEIDVYGFDSGTGLPPPQDYRDLPNLWSQGEYGMDADKLRSRLTCAKLILGDVKETVSGFLTSNPARVGFVAFDLDYYSSTVQALKLFEADQSLLMPRIYCYFDDILGFTFGHHNGERLAISEFNERRPERQISPIYGLRYTLPERCFNASWAEQMYITHILDHDLYAVPDGLVRGKDRDLAES